MDHFYEKTGQVTAAYDHQTRTIIVTWLIMSDAQIIKECTLAQLEMVKKGARAIIVDTINARGFPPPPVQEWFGSTLFPALRDAGLKTIITILPKNSATKLATKRWNKTGAPFDFDMYDAQSMQDARQLLKEYV